MVKVIKKSEKIVLLICIIAVILTSILIQNLEKIMPSASENGEAIGQVRIVQADVRHKSKKAYFWQPTDKNRSLSEGDSVFTGPKSFAEISFQDGRKVRIAENSLIHFSTKKNELNVALAFGKMATSGLTKPMIITDCEKTYTIEANGGSFEISKNKQCGEVKLQVLSGQVKLNKKNILKKTTPTEIKTELVDSEFEKSLLSFKQPEIPAVAAKEVIKEIIKAPEINVTPAKFGSSLATAAQVRSRIKMKWTGDPLATHYDFESATNLNFRNAKIIRTESNKIEILLEQGGIHYYRIKSYSQDGKASEYSKIHMLHATFPSIEITEKKLQANYVAKYSSDAGKKKDFAVTWTPVPLTEKYVVEVSHSAEFAASTKIESRNPASVIEVPRTGKYLYRVTAFDKQGRQISSSSAPGEIEYTKLFDLTAPILDRTLKTMSFYFQKEFGQFIWLKWNNLALKENFKYRIQLSNQNEFSSLNYNQITNESKFLLNKNLAQGTYFWRVRAESSDQFSDWSDIGTIKIQTKPTPSSNQHGQ